MDENDVKGFEKKCVEIGKIDTFKLLSKQVENLAHNTYLYVHFLKKRQHKLALNSSTNTERYFYFRYSWVAFRKGYYQE